MDNQKLKESKLKAQTTYNSASDNYEKPALSFWERYGKQTVDNLNLSRGLKVLDVCSGTGASAIPAARSVGESGSVTAVDFAQNMLNIASEKAARNNLKNISFINGDMTNLPFEKESFDAVIVVFGIFFVPDMESQVNYLWNLVKPGGKLAVTTWGPELFEPAYSVWLDQLKIHCPELYSDFNPWDRITTPVSVRKLLADGGVENITVIEENGKQAINDHNDFWIVALGSGLRWTIDKMGDEKAEKVKNTLSAYIKKNNVEFIETNVIYGIGEKPNKPVN